MSVLSQESIKHLTKSELKNELTKWDLPLNGRKDDLLKRLTETLNEESNKVDETEKHLQNISIETIKELFIEMFKAQEETIRKIVSSCNSDTIVRLDRLSEEIQDNNKSSIKNSRSQNKLRHIPINIRKEVSKSKW